jgi:hypothetical protein
MQTDYAYRPCHFYFALAGRRDLFPVSAREDNMDVRGCQFIHIESYARKGAIDKSGTARRSIWGIHAELMRQPHACKHVNDPKAPEIIFGSVQETFEIAQQRGDCALDTIGRKLRITSPVMVAGVISSPVKTAEITRDPHARRQYLAFRDDTIEWLKQRYGEDFRCAAEHLDEAYPHIHFFLVPRVTPSGQMSIATLHPGYLARRQAQARGATRAEGNEAYKNAMSAFQDDFYRSVSIHHGLTRDGPKRQRVTRTAYVAQAKQACEFSAHLDKLRKQTAEREDAQQREMIDRESYLRGQIVSEAQKAKLAMAEKAAAIMTKIHFQHVSEMEQAKLSLAEANAQLAQAHEILIENGIVLLPGPIA